jgi:hypothetical protein
LKIINFKLLNNPLFIRIKLSFRLFLVIIYLLLYFIMYFMIIQFLFNVFSNMYIFYLSILFIFSLCDFSNIISYNHTQTLYLLEKVHGCKMCYCQCTSCHISYIIYNTIYTILVLSFSSLVLYNNPFKY